MAGKASGKGAAKLAVPEIIPDRLMKVPVKELVSVNRRLYQLWSSNFADNTKMTAGDLNREDLVNAAKFVWAEMERRGFEVSRDTSLWRAANRTLTKCEDDGEDEPETWLREEAYEFAEITEDGGEDAGEVDTTQDSGD